MRVNANIVSGALQALIDESNAGEGAAMVELWSGSPPATIDGSPEGDKLAECECSVPVWLSPVGNTVTADEITAGEGLTNGEIGFVRLVNADGDVVLDEPDVGTEGTKVVVTSKQVTAGLPVTITSWTIDYPTDDQ